MNQASWVILDRNFRCFIAEFQYSKFVDGWEDSYIDFPPSPRFHLPPKNMLNDACVQFQIDSDLIQYTPNCKKPHNIPNKFRNLSRKLCWTAHRVRSHIPHTHK